MSGGVAVRAPLSGAFLRALGVCIVLCVGPHEVGIAQEARRPGDVAVRLLSDLSVDYLAYRPMPSVAWQGDSAVALLDAYDQQVVVHALRSGERRRIGREGGGPGEFGGVFDLAATADGEIYVVDNQLARLSRFAPNGRFVDSYPLPGFSNAVTAGGGVVYLDWSPAYSPNEEPLSTIGRVDRRAGEITPLFRLIDVAPGLLDPPDEAPDHRAWRPMAADGAGRLFVGGRYTYRFVVLARDGRRAAGFGREMELEYRSDAEFAAHAREAEDLASDLGVPEAVVERSLEKKRHQPKAFFVSFAVDDRGGVWVPTHLRVPGAATRVDYFPPGERAMSTFRFRDRVLALAVTNGRVATLVERLGPSSLGRHGLDVYEVQPGRSPDR